MDEELETGLDDGAFAGFSPVTEALHMEQNRSIQPEEEQPGGFPSNGIGATATEESELPGISSGNFRRPLAVGFGAGRKGEPLMAVLGQNGSSQIMEAHIPLGDGNGGSSTVCGHNGGLCRLLISTEGGSTHFLTVIGNIPIPAFPFTLHTSLVPMAPNHIPTPCAVSFPSSLHLPKLDCVDDLVMNKEVGGED